MHYKLIFRSIDLSRKATTLAFSFLLIFHFQVFAQTIDRGPYLQSGTSESIVIKWRTTTPTSSKVWYGNSPSNLNLTLSSAVSTTEHEILISGLNLNTTYYYAVGNSNGQMAGADANHYFTTSPDTSGNQIVRIWALGDCGTANNSQRDVRDAYYSFIGNNHTDAILLLGDNAYTDGTQEEYQMALFENMYEEKLINSVLWPSFGNHDGHSSLSITQTGPYYDIFTVPKNAEAGGFPSGTEAYYSFDYGNIHFICLNSDDIDADPEEAMMQWLQNDLESTSQEWIIAFFHHSPYTGSQGNESDFTSSATDMREIAAPILEAGGVDLVLAGHTHAYQRSYLMTGHYNDSPTFDPNTMIVDPGDGRIDGDGAYFKARGDEGVGTVYVVAGSSGKLDEDDYNYPAMIHNVEELGSVAVEVDGLQMDVKFINSEGIIQDYFTILKIVDPPVVNITYPADQEYFPAPESITITAEAEDPNGNVTHVEFFVDNISIGTDLVAPYTVDWNIPSEGIFKIKAVATDNEGFSSSSLVHINVGILEVCSRVNSSSDDAEEKEDGVINLTSGDLELVDDGSDQTIGMRFKNLNIPQCAEINNAFVQFTVDGIDNINPCNLNFYAEAGDSPATFSENDFNISGRARTNATVAWSPVDWVTIGEEGTNQQSVNIAPLIQEVVNRPGFSENSSIVIIIDGIGKREAETYDGEPLSAPKLCVEYIPFGPDSDDDGVCDALDQCPEGPEPGMSCDDGNPETSNDMINSNCECGGMIIYDCPNIQANFGDPCDDGNPETSNDAINSGCECEGEGGTIYDCPNIQANFGDPCDDGNPETSNDVVNSNCECEGGTIYDCPTIQANFGDPCDDGNPETSNDVINSDCECEGEGEIIYDCPNIQANFGDPCDDGDEMTTNDQIDTSCNCTGSTFISISVNNSSDDAEEDETGDVNLTSSDLEMVIDGNSNQVIGMRFDNLNINQGSIIDSAYIQFTAEEADNINPCELQIYGEASDDAQTFTTAENNISNRPKTNSIVSWWPEDWQIVEESGIAQRTADITPIIQEIVDRAGFDSESAISIIVEGFGNRTAISFDGDSEKAPKINIRFKNATVGLEHIPVTNISTILVYPVPAKDRLNVSVDCYGSQEVPIQIRDVNGRLLFSEMKQVVSGKNELLLDNLALPDGMYFIQLYLDGMVRTAKFIILR